MKKVDTSGTQHFSFQYECTMYGSSCDRSSLNNSEHEKSRMRDDKLFTGSAGELGSLKKEHRGDGPQLAAKNGEFSNTDEDCGSTPANDDLLRLLS